MLNFWFKISRPRFWFYLAGPFLIGFAAAIDSPQSFMSYFFIIFFLYFLWPANILLYGINDLFDLKTDLLNPKKENKEMRLINPIERKAIVLFSILFFIFSALLFIYLSSDKAKIVLLLFILLSFFYSAPPLRFKSLPVLDSLSNGLYILPGFFSYVFISGQWPTWEIMVALWAWAAAMHLFSAIIDIKADKKVHLYTSAVVLGHKKALYFCFILWLVFSLLLIHSQALSFLSYLSLVYPITILYILFKKIPAIKIYWYFPWLNSILGFFAFWYLLLFK